MCGEINERFGFGRYFPIYISRSVTFAIPNIHRVAISIKKFPLSIKGKEEFPYFPERYGPVS